MDEHNPSVMELTKVERDELMSAGIPLEKSAREALEHIVAAGGEDARRLYDNYAAKRDAIAKGDTKALEKIIESERKTLVG